jgi:hypothetical protein
MGSILGQTAGVCRRVCLLGTVFGLSAIFCTNEASAQSRGSVVARAQVLEAAPGRAGIEGAARLVKGWHTAAKDSTSRLETRYATVSLAPQAESDVLSQSRSSRDVPRRAAVLVSVQFLRN